MTEGGIVQLILPSSTSLFLFHYIFQYIGTLKGLIGGSKDSVDQDSGYKDSVDQDTPLSSPG